MCSIDGLFANQHVARIPEFFAPLARQQSPRSLRVGCAHSRVSANEILGLQPGELFVHRNIASVRPELPVRAAVRVETLKVEHAVGVGHYGCGGVQAVAERRSTVLAENWLSHIRTLRTSTKSGSSTPVTRHEPADDLLRRVGAGKPLDRMHRPSLQALN